MASPMTWTMGINDVSVDTDNDVTNIKISSIHIRDVTSTSAIHGNSVTNSKISSIHNSDATNWLKAPWAYGSDGRSNTAF